MADWTKRYAHERRYTNIVTMVLAPWAIAALAALAWWLLQ